MKNSTDSKQIVESSKNPKVSMCGIMKDNTSEIIQKLELEMPVFFQGYSDLYSKYLHSFKDVFGACHIAEKQYFDKLEIDPEILKKFDEYFKSITNSSKTQIDLYRDFLKSYFDTQSAIVASSDNYTHVMMDSYAKMLSQFIPKSN